MGAPEVLFVAAFALLVLVVYALVVAFVRRARRDPDPRSTYDDDFWSRP